MAYYVEKLGGFVADNPNIDFERCDGKVFNYYSVNTASINDTAESLTINGGQSRFPLAIIDTTRNMELTFDSSEFTMDMFELANATSVENGDATTDILESDLFEVTKESDKLVVKIPCAITAKSVYIAGFTAAETVAAGKYTVTAPSGDATSTVITFNAGDVAEGDNIRVSYRRVVGTAAKIVSVKTNYTTAKGSATFHWPVYSAGTDCTESAIKAWLHLTVYKVRVTALPQISNSYKSAATMGLTFTSMDPKRADKKMCDWVYEVVDED